MTAKTLSALGLVAALAATGCSAQAGPLVEPRAARVAVDSSPTAPASDEAQHTLRVGDGLNLVATVPNPLDTGERWHLVAVTPDGSLVADILEEGSQDSHRAALIAPRTGKVTYLSKAGPAAVFAADADGRYVVWVETTATDLFTFPWVAYSYDRRTGRTVQVAEPPDVGVSPVPAAPDGTVPSLSGDRVYLAAVSAMRGKRVVPAVYSAPVDGAGALRTEVADAFGGAVSGGKLVYQRADAGSFRHWEVRARDLRREGSDAVIAEGVESRFSGLAADAGVVMWQTMEGERCTLSLRIAGARVSDLNTGDCDRAFAYYPRATSEYVSYSVASDAGGYRSFVYDMGTRSLRALTDERVAESPKGAGRFLAWTPLTGPDAGDVLVATLE